MCVCMRVCVYTRGVCQRCFSATIRGGPRNGEDSRRTGNTQQAEAGSERLGRLFQTAHTQRLWLVTVCGSDGSVCWRRWPVRGRNVCAVVVILRPVWLTSFTGGPLAEGVWVPAFRIAAKKALYPDPGQQQHRAHADTGTGTRGAPRLS